MLLATGPAQPDTVATAAGWVASLACAGIRQETQRQIRVARVPVGYLRVVVAVVLGTN